MIFSTKFSWFIFPWAIQVNPWFPEKNKPASKEHKLSTSKKKPVAQKKDLFVEQTEEEEETNGTTMFP